MREGEINLDEMFEDYRKEIVRLSIEIVEREEKNLILEELIKKFLIILKEQDGTPSINRSDER